MVDLESQGRCSLFEKVNKVEVEGKCLLLKWKLDRPENFKNCRPENRVPRGNKARVLKETPCIWNQRSVQESSDKNASRDLRDASLTSTETDHSYIPLFWLHG